MNADERRFRSETDFPTRRSGAPQGDASDAARPRSFLAFYLCAFVFIRGFIESFRLRDRPPGAQSVTRRWNTCAVACGGSGSERFYDGAGSCFSGRYMIASWRLVGRRS